MGNPARNYPPAHVSLGRRFFSLPTAISLIAVISLVVFLVLRLDISLGETWRVIRDINPILYLLAVFIHYLTFLFRGARWRLLLINAARGEDATFKAPSLKYSSTMMLMSWFANSVTVFRMGDAFRAYAYAEDTHSSFSGSMGTVVADRMVDFGVVVGLMVAAIALLYVEGETRPPIEFVLLGTIVLIAIAVGLVAMVLFRARVVHRLPKRLEGIYHRFHTGTMGSFGQLHWVFLLGVLAWACEVGSWLLVVTALGADVSLGLILFVPPTNVVLSVIPLTPGGLGIVEAGITGLLQLQVTVEVALAAALVDRTLSILSMATGGVAFAVRQVMITRRPSASKMEQSGVVQPRDCR